MVSTPFGHKEDVLWWQDPEHRAAWRDGAGAICSPTASRVRGRCAGAVADRLELAPWLDPNVMDEYVRPGRVAAPAEGRGGLELVQVRVNKDKRISTHESFTHVKERATDADAHEQFFDMVMTVTKNDDSSTPRWTEGTMARGGAYDLECGKVRDRVAKGPYYGFSRAWVSDETCVLTRTRLGLSRGLGREAKSQHGGSKLSPRPDRPRRPGVPRCIAG